MRENRKNKGDGFRTIPQDLLKVKHRLLAFGDQRQEAFSNLDVLFNRVDFQVFTVAVHFTADRSQTVQGGDTHGSGGVAVRGATGLHPSDIETLQIAIFFNQAGQYLGGFAQANVPMVCLCLHDALPISLVASLKGMAPWWFFSTISCVTPATHSCWANCMILALTSL